MTEALERETLRCPVCRTGVAPTSSMCLKCHLPITDVRRHQPPRGTARVRSAARRVVTTTVLLAAVLLVGAITAVHFGWLDRGHGPAQEITHSHPEIDDQDGHFGGQVQLTNHTPVQADVSITVTVYDGDQDLGSVSGDASVKPHSSTMVTLSGLDTFQPFTDTVVEMDPLPAGTD